MSWLPLLFEAGLAILMVALIVYCVKLNGRLSALRNQNAEIAELIDGLQNASERADASVQRLKEAGLAAERSLRAAIEEASAVRADLKRPVQPRVSGGPSQPVPRRAPLRKAEKGAAARPDREPDASTAATADPAARAGRDMLMANGAGAAGGAPAPVRGRPSTREEAEETLLEAIRSARGGA